MQNQNQHPKVTGKKMWNRNEILERKWNVFFFAAVVFLSLPLRECPSTHTLEYCWPAPLFPWGWEMTRWLSKSDDWPHPFGDWFFEEDDDIIMLFNQIYTRKVNFFFFVGEIWKQNNNLQTIKLLFGFFKSCHIWTDSHSFRFPNFFCNIRFFSIVRNRLNFDLNMIIAHPKQKCPNINGDVKTKNNFWIVKL